MKLLSHSIGKIFLVTTLVVLGLSNTLSQGLSEKLSESGVSRKLTSETMRTLERNLSQRRFNNDWSYYTDEEVKAYQLQRELESKRSDIFLLQQAKKGMINGDLELAKFFLNKISDRTSNLTLIKKRYLATIAFIEGDYYKSLKYLEDPKFNQIEYFKEICLLKVINNIALDKNKELKAEAGTCQNLTSNFSSNNQFWLTTLLRIQEKDEDLIKGNLIENLRKVLTSVDFTETWMKMALFLNKERILLKYVGKLTQGAFRSKKVRELIGFAYYRIGDNKRALEFIEGLETPNADNIRGNINLAEKKYELAFGHFKLALKKKPNSQNALQRALPLAYILGLWDEGIDMLNRIVGDILDKRKKVTLETVFTIRKGKFVEARQLLNYLDDLFKKSFPRPVTLLDAYTALRLGENHQLEMASANACRDYDGLHCWLNMQILNWENIGQTITRTDKTFVLESFDLEALKAKSPVSPLKESVIIDQNDIEELDSNLVKIR